MDTAAPSTVLPSLASLDSEEALQLEAEPLDLPQGERKAVFKAIVESIL